MNTGITITLFFIALVRQTSCLHRKEFLFPDEPTLLVSFARSGNSPESVATVKIANEQIKTLFHLTITCAKEGQLAKERSDN